MQMLGRAVRACCFRLRLVLMFVNTQGRPQFGKTVWPTLVFLHVLIVRNRQGWCGDHPLRN
jgi:hypothetical protein